MPRWVPASLFGMERPSKPIGPEATAALLPVSRAAASSCKRVHSFFKTPRAKTGALCFFKTPLPMPLPVGLRFLKATRRSTAEGGRFMSRTICCCYCHRAVPFQHGTVRTILLWATVPPKAVPWLPLGPKFFLQTNAIAVPTKQRTVVVSAVCVLIFRCGQTLCPQHLVPKHDSPYYLCFYFRRLRVVGTIGKVQHVNVVANDPS